MCLDWQRDFMRVAVFTDNDFDQVSGLTTTLTALVSHRPPDLGLRIYTAAALDTDVPTHLALRSASAAIPFAHGARLYLPRWRRYLRQVVADGADLLHLTTPGPLGLTAVRIASKTGRPLIGSIHSDLAIPLMAGCGSPRLGRYVGRYLRWFYGRCETVLVPSDAARAVLEAARFPAERLRVWRHGVDTACFSPSRRSWQRRERWRVSDSRPALLYVGGLSRDTGVEMLPELLQRLRVGGVAHRLIVVGDGPLRAWLARVCDDAVFTGPLGRDALAEAFASADVLLSPRTGDGGHVLLEAQSSGLPAIVGDRDAAGGGSGDGQTVFVCAETAVAAWVATVTRVLRDPAWRCAVSRASRAYALERDWNAALAEVYGEYWRVAASRHRLGAVHHAA
jgi:phosphatidylinositol alpha 1,6-mannosyltransferase